MRRIFKPRDPHDFIGQYCPRIDGQEKAKGRAQFLDDLATKRNVPGMLHAKVLRSPYPHARIKSLDSSKAEKLAGVRAVLRYDDPVLAAMPWTSHAWTGVAITPIERDTLPRYFDRRVLSERACWVGDEMGVAVAAETEEIADEALRLMDIEWEVLPFVLDYKEAMKADAPVIHPEINPQGNILPPDPRGTMEWEGNNYMPEGIARDVFVSRGEKPVEEVFAHADAVIEANAIYHNPDHGCLDTMGCLIAWDGDQLTCWTNAYQGDQTRVHIAQMLDLPLHQVRVVCTYLGASMGRWNVGDQTFYIFTALLAKMTGRPVKFKHTRREDFHDTRQHIDWTCTMGATKDGKIIAARFQGLADCGAYAEHVGCILKFIPLEIDHRSTAHIPNMKMEGYGIYTNKIPGGMMRCTGNIQFNLPLGIAVDMMADRLNMDPVELTLRNFGHQWGSLPDKSLEAVLSEGARKIRWDRRHKPARGKIYDGSKRRGLGYSFHNGWHTEWEEVPRGSIQIKVRLNPDLTVILDAPLVETGCGSSSCNVFSCAESLSFLGVRPEHVKWISKVDTDLGIRDCVATDSAVSYLQSELMPLAARAIKEKILEFAGPVFAVSPEELEIVDGRVFVKDAPQNGKTVRDLLWMHGDMAPILVTVNRMPDGSMTGVPFAATFLEVEVDMETGKVQVLEMVVVDDVGTVMHASGAEAQQLGGQAMALGETLTEEIVYDETTGVPLNLNWIDYQIPTMADYPDVDPVLMEIWKGAGEYGACGLGEGVMTRTPAALSNAIYNAIGVRITEMPFKPEKILKALGRCS